MIIKKIEWISKSAEEAIAYVSDDVFECAAFSHPCNFNIGYFLTEPLLAFNAKGIMKSENKEIFISRQLNSLAHEINGQLCDSNIVKIGKINIELEDFIPSDLAIGDFVQFSCGRLDLIR